MGVITVELLSEIRRWHLRDQMSIREVAKRTGLSRNIIIPQYVGQGRTNKHTLYVDKLQQWLN